MRSLRSTTMLLTALLPMSACANRAPVSHGMTSAAPAITGSATTSDVEPFPAGWYQSSPTHRVLVTRGPGGGLRLLDFDSANFAALRERAPNVYTWSQDSGVPTRTVAFTIEDGTSAAVLAWTDSAGGRGHMTRAARARFNVVPVQFRSTDSTLLVGVMLIPTDRKFVGRSGGVLREVPMKFPGAVIIQGSGSSDRDNIWAYQWAQFLAEHGIAVLLPDKRGSGDSKGDWHTAGFTTLSDDAIAAAHVLAANPSVDASRIGYVGLSQGGWIAPLTSHRAGAAFVVDISGAAVAPYDQFIHETQQDLHAAHVDSAGIASITALLELARAFVHARTPVAWNAYADMRTRLAAGPLAPIVAEAAADSTDSFWQWWRLIGDYDPIPDWKLIRAPLFVAYGADDEFDNVPVAKSVSLLEPAVNTASIPSHQVHVFPNVGHTLYLPNHQFDDAARASLATWIAMYVAH